MKREFLQNLKVGDSSLPKEIIDAIMAQNGQDIESAKAASREWEDKYNRALDHHDRQMRQLQLQSALEAAVTKTGGRNTKAIAALLDMEAISQQEDVAGALETALEELKQENSYLFDTPTPPPYAPNTGTAGSGSFAGAMTLAGALRERMNKR